MLFDVNLLKAIKTDAKDDKKALIKAICPISFKASWDVQKNHD